eukprot:3967126-Amphidinium_carterae.2
MPDIEALLPPLVVTTKRAHVGSLHVGASIVAGQASTGHGAGITSAACKEHYQSAIVCVCVLLRMGRLIHHFLSVSSLHRSSMHYEYLSTADQGLRLANTTALARLSEKFLVPPTL